MRGHELQDLLHDEFAKKGTAGREVRFLIHTDVAPEGELVKFSNITTSGNYTDIHLKPFPRYKNTTDPYDEEDPGRQSRDD